MISHVGLFWNFLKDVFKYFSKKREKKFKLNIDAEILIYRDTPYIRIYAKSLNELPIDLKFLKLESKGSILYANDSYDDIAERLSILKDFSKKKRLKYGEEHDDSSFFIKIADLKREYPEYEKADLYVIFKDEISNNYYEESLNDLISKSGLEI